MRYEFTNTIEDQMNYGETRMHDESIFYSHLGLNYENNFDYLKCEIKKHDAIIDYINDIINRFNADLTDLEYNNLFLICSDHRVHHVYENTGTAYQKDFTDVSAFEVAYFSNFIIEYY